MLSGCYSVDLRTIGKSINGPRIARRRSVPVFGVGIRLGATYEETMIKIHYPLLSLVLLALPLEIRSETIAKAYDAEIELLDGTKIPLKEKETLTSAGVMVCVDRGQAMGEETYVFYPWNQIKKN